MNTVALPADALAQKRLILLVDDDELLLVLLQAIVESQGYEVCVASSGKQALELIAQADRLPDLALLDISMPDMSGLELAAHLNSGSLIPFMFLSSDGEASMVAQATDAGAVGYLVKPFTNAQIGPTIASALARAADIRALRQNEARLLTALGFARDTDIAVGMLIERYDTDRETALRVLRDHARANHRKLVDVAAELVGASALLNGLAVRIKELMRK